MVRLVRRRALVSPEELHVAISVPCSDKFTVPQHAHRQVHAHSEAFLALTRPACLDRPLSHALTRQARPDRSRAPPSSSHNRRVGYLMAAILPKASSTSFLTCGL